MVGLLAHLLLVLLQPANSQVIFYPQNLQVWENKNCKVTDTCDLKAARLSTQRWRADFTRQYGPGAYNFGDTMTMSYETQSKQSLENYAIVQYVKGCVYRNYINAQGELRTFFIDARFSHNATLRSNASIWIQKNWIIDSDDKDPMYNSPFPSDLDSMSYPSRHGLYRWNRIQDFDTNNIPTSREADTESLFGYVNPPLYPKLYITDRPGTAFLAEQFVDGIRVNAAKNISLDFKACLYRTKDIPLSVDDMGEEVFVKNPLTCFDWKSRQVYNWGTKAYENPSEMSQECLRYEP